MNYQILIFSIFVVFALIEARHSSFFNKSNEVKADGIVELVGTVLLFVFTQPFILFSAAWLASLLVPQFAGVLSDTSIWLQFALLIIFDDMTQYWWHRTSHNYIPLYKLHRAHHNAKYMSIRIVYRNSYEIRLLHPVMWLLERIISTPSTHSGHHGLSKDDPATHYKGNYGNMFFFWDILFGTAKITRQYPLSYGVEGMRKAEWTEQLFWPLAKTKKKSPTEKIQSVES